MQLPHEIFKALGVEQVVAEVEPEAGAQEIGEERFSRVVAHQGDELHRVGGAGHVAGHDHAFVARASLALLRLAHVVAGAHHQHPLGFSDPRLHEGHQIGAVPQIPLIQGGVYTLAAQILRQLAHPGLMGG